MFRTICWDYRTALTEAGKGETPWASTVNHGVPMLLSFNLIIVTTYFRPRYYKASCRRAKLHKFASIPYNSYLQLQRSFVIANCSTAVLSVRKFLKIHFILTTALKYLLTSICILYETHIFPFGNVDSGLGIRRCIPISNHSSKHI